MISGNSLFQPMDIDARRRRALAAVYAFLLKLAEEKKKAPEILEPKLKQENTSVPLQEKIPT